MSGTPCQRLEARGLVHRVAVSPVSPCRRKPCGSGVRRRRRCQRTPAPVGNADAHTQAFAGEIARDDARKNRARGVERVARMARVLDGNVERGHHAVPGKLRADVVVLADDPRDFVEIRVDHLDRARSLARSFIDVKPATSANSKVASR